MKKISLTLLSFLTISILFSCQGTSSLVSSSNISSSSTNSSFDNTVNETKEYIDAYVSSVGDTGPILTLGMHEGTKVDYVISSYPIIYASMINESKATDLSIKYDIAQEFGKKFSTEGFPQAGLFIKKSLEEDESKKESIEKFLNTFDAAIDDLISGGSQAVTNMNNYSSDVSVQSSRFGFNANVLKGVQETNGLAFIARDDNPSKDEFSIFNEPLVIDFSSASFSTYYSTDYNPSTSETTSELEFTVTSPSGAPSAALTAFASSDNLVTGSAQTVQAAFASAESDFIIFDSVNGMKLAGDNYSLVRMVTFGNLYVVSTGNDTDETFSPDDYVVSYGQGLVPDLAFKAAFEG